MSTFGPVSMDRPTVAAWLTEESRPRKIYRRWASKHAELMHEWAAMRAGELDPEQREDQHKAAVEYVTRIVQADATPDDDEQSLRPKGLGATLFLEFVLPFLLQALASVLFDWLFGSEKFAGAKGALPEWRAYVSSGGQFDGREEPAE